MLICIIYVHTSLARRKVYVIRSMRVLRSPVTCTQARRNDLGVFSTKPDDGMLLYKPLAKESAYGRVLQECMLFTIYLHRESRKGKSNLHHRTVVSNVKYMDLQHYIELGLNREQKIASALMRATGWWISERLGVISELNVPSKIWISMWVKGWNIWPKSVITR